MRKERLEQEFSLLDIHFSRFLGTLSALPPAEKKKFEALVLQLSAALAGGDSCLDFSAEADSLALLHRLPETLCISEKEYRDGAHAPLVLFNNKLFLYRYFHYEFRLARQLLNLAQKKQFPTEKGLILLDTLFPTVSGGEKDLQKEAAKLAISRQLAIISGGPGTGKTTTVAKILVLLLDEAENRGESLPEIVLAAPTGKAAIRLGQSVADSIESFSLNDERKRAIPCEAVTLHRLLGVRNSSGRFIHNADNPLDCSVLVVDEASMVDLALMSKLVDALSPSCRLILLGDKEQLASVESGAVLAELLKSLPECGVHLQKSYRFDGNIKELALAVNAGDVDGGWRLMEDSTRKSLSLLSGDWFSFLAERFLPYMENVLEVVRKKKFGVDDVAPLFEGLRSFQILCATRKGRRGVEQVNREIVSFIDKKIYRVGYGCFAGCPVIITSNDYTLGLFNGDVGICLPAETGQLNVWFEHFEKGIISVPYGRLPENETAFAITIHKSQGSEFGEVAVLLPEKVHHGLGRELLYTGITRTKKKVWLLTEREVFAVALDCSVSRQSGLRDLLKGV